VKWTLILLNKIYKKLYKKKSGLFIHGRQFTDKVIQRRRQKNGLRFVVANRWVLIQVLLAAQRSFQRAHLYNEEMETENLSTAASQFGLRSATELVGDKEPHLPPKPSSVTTLASASGPSGRSCDNFQCLCFLFTMHLCGTNSWASALLSVFRSKIFQV